MSINSTNPSTYFGGTWERIAKGRTLVGVDENDTDFNASSKTGGEKEHTLTVDEMPAHIHTLTVVPNGASTGTQKQACYYIYTNAQTYTESTDVRGDDQPHNNLQPFYTCYIWLRTA